ncbi:MAG: tetratricopeptide repeat protein [Spirochaetales bacterium]|nr:tetratricopeptide repeat protein [Spirochaetales bacterium]
MRRKSFLALLLLLLFISLYSTGCSVNDYSFYLKNSGDEKHELNDLFNLLENKKSSGEQRFILVDRIAGILGMKGEKEKQILFLTDYVEKHPVDPYNAFYLLLVAQNYEEQKEYPLAVHYYNRILKNYPDLLYKGRSVHFHCLTSLVKLVDKPEFKVQYYKELIARFSDNIDLGVTYYYLAKTYEKLGEWDLAIQAYKNFLQYPKSEISGIENAHGKIKEKVAFYYSDKSWTVPDLETLIREIKKAIRLRSPRRLLRYKAKVNFFTKSWEQQTDSRKAAVFDLGSFLRKSKIRIANKLDIDSNAREAYLKTTRWTYRIPTWYLYFRKIDFKADPDIDGRWEWAGIYFGEKL